VAGKRSAGILLFRRSDNSADGRSNTGVEVLIGHLGGPFWARRDAGGWTVPKGECEPGETPELAARREFREELGLPAPDGELRPLGEVTMSGGKVVTVWAVEADLDPARVTPGVFDLEWPPRSGTIRQFPELDRVGWFELEAARDKLVKGQRPFLDRLAELLTA
jgi:predicted NUDIX family NTP pyrophosphohydrolase